MVTINQSSDLFYPNTLTDGKSVKIELFHPDYKDETDVMVYNATINVSENSSGRLHQFKAFVEMSISDSDDGLSSLYSSNNHVIYSKDIITKNIGKIVNQRLFELFHKKESDDKDNPHYTSATLDLYSVDVEFINFNQRTTDGFYLDEPTEENIKRGNYDFDVFFSFRDGGREATLMRLEVRRLPHLPPKNRSIYHIPQPASPENNLPAIRELLFDKLSEYMCALNDPRCYLQIKANGHFHMDDRIGNYGFTNARIEFDVNTNETVFLVER